VIDIGDGPMEFINPVILEQSGEQTGGEGCLSLPGKIAKVTRANHVVCEAYDRTMTKFTVEAEELLARAILHEYDHLDGILYKDVADGPLCDVDDYEED
jgi:peptide deformylase